MFDKGQERERKKRQKNRERKKALPDREKMKVFLSRKPTETSDLKQFKEPVLAYELRSPCAKQNLNNQATQDRIILQDWEELSSFGIQRSLLSGCTLPASSSR